MRTIIDISVQSTAVSFSFYTDEQHNIIEKKIKELRNFVSRAFWDETKKVAQFRSENL